jgi:hypothetical protein
MGRSKTGGARYTLHKRVKCIIIDTYPRYTLAAVADFSPVNEL